MRRQEYQFWFDIYFTKFYVLFHMPFRTYLFAPFVKNAS